MKKMTQNGDELFLNIRKWMACAVQNMRKSLGNNYLIRTIKSLLGLEFRFCKYSKHHRSTYRSHFTSILRSKNFFSKNQFSELRRQNAFIFSRSSPHRVDIDSRKIFFCPANLNSSYEAESFRLLVSARNQQLNQELEILLQICSNKTSK